MGEKEYRRGRKCFIITPIGDEDSFIFRKTKGVIESAIRPVLQRYNFDNIKPAYEIMDFGMIGNQVMDGIINADLVIANLTGINPNVMYELAVRHITAKPIIHICEKGTILPFDIKDSRTIFYSDDMLGVEELKILLEKFVVNIDYLKEYKDNPVYNGKNRENIFCSGLNDDKFMSHGKADILVRMQSDEFQMDEFQKKINELLGLDVIGVRAIGNVFLIYIKSDGKEKFEDACINLRRISKKLRIKVFFIDDLRKNRNK